LSIAVRELSTLGCVALGTRQKPVIPVKCNIDGNFGPIMFYVRPCDMIRATFTKAAFTMKKCGKMCCIFTDFLSHIIPVF
jgi:hypothetical protein